MKDFKKIAGTASLVGRRCEIVEIHSTIITECPRSAAEQQWKRLEMEGKASGHLLTSHMTVYTRIRASLGFLLLELTEVDGVGMVETRTARAKSQLSKKQKQKTQTSSYVFNFAIKNTSAYEDYFDPGGKPEKKMLGLHLVVLTQSSDVCHLTSCFQKHRGKREQKMTVSQFSKISRINSF